MRLCPVYMTWRPLPKAAWFENAAKNGAFSKRYGIICHADSKTISIWVRLPLWREICILQFKIVNLAWSLGLCFPSLKRSKLSLYFLWTDSQSTPSAILLTLYSYSSYFLRSSTTLWTEMYLLLWWEKQHSRFFLTQIPVVCDDFSMPQTMKTVLCKHFQTASILVRFSKSWNCIDIKPQQICKHSLRKLDWKLIQKHESVTM